MTELSVGIGGEPFAAQFEWARAPEACKALGRLLPYSEALLHARWSGEACWAPLGERKLLPLMQNTTSEPAPGELLVYQGPISETELLVPYGDTRFACRAGPLEGCHIVTILADLPRFAETARNTLWHGASRIEIDWSAPG